MITVIGSVTHTARKEHRCDSCLRGIAPGTSYQRSRCVDGGDAWTWKAHHPCTDAGIILWRQGICGEEDALINVCDMDYDDRLAIYRADPETFRAVWPDKPIPGLPEGVPT